MGPRVELLRGPLIYRDQTEERWEWVTNPCMLRAPLPTVISLPCSSRPLTTSSIPFWKTHFFFCALNMPISIHQSLFVHFFFLCWNYLPIYLPLPGFLFSLICLLHDQLFRAFPNISSWKNYLAHSITWLHLILRIALITTWFTYACLPSGSSVSPQTTYVSLLYS